MPELVRHAQRRPCAGCASNVFVYSLSEQQVALCATCHRLAVGEPICRYCARPLAANGEAWVHANGRKYNHPAEQRVNTQRGQHGA